MNRLCVLVPLFLCGLAAQTRPPAAPKSPVHARAAPAARAAISDAELEKDIRARFARSKIAADHLQVRVQGGVATIEGRSDVIQHKGTATRMARNAGAVRVVNNVQLSQAAKDKAANNLAKGRRRAQIKRGDARSDDRPMSR